MPVRDVVILSAARTPIGRYGGSFKDLGESELVLAGGIESMSRMPYLIDASDAGWGHRMGNFTLVDAMYRDGFQCPISNLIMGETAEILGRQYGITREQSDAFARDSQRKARAAIDAGYFGREIAPVALAARAGWRRCASAAAWEWLWRLNDANSDYSR